MSVPAQFQSKEAGPALGAKLGPGSRDWFDLGASGIVAAAVLMNCILAFINAKFFGISNGTVIMCQIALTLSAASLFIWRLPQVSANFYLSLIFISLFWFIVFLNSYQQNFKALYDALLIPIFILLGTTVRRAPTLLIRTLLAVTLAVAFFETLLPDAYIQTLEPLRYYVATREWVAEGASSANFLEAGLYVGSNRAGGQWFSFLSEHRVGSIFLEPLSMSYFAVVSAIFFVTQPRLYAFSHLPELISCLLISLMSDSRLPSVMVGMIVITHLLRAQPPKFLALMVIPLTLVVCGIVYEFNVLNLPFEDTFYRLSITFDPLFNMTFSEALLGGLSARVAGDSGWVYLVKWYGVAGALLVLYTCCGFIGVPGLVNKTPVTFYAAAYAATTLLFGAAVFSIKTAALFGFVLGAAARTFSPTPANPPTRAALQRRDFILSYRSRVE